MAVERVRPVGPGDNVTDAVMVEALGACAATYAAQEEASEAAKTARSLHSNELKKWKKRGLHLEALKKAVKDRFTDPGEVLAELHNYTRMRALQNMPTIQTDLMAMWREIDLTTEQKAEIDRQRWRDDGSFSARQGYLRDTNPHEAGSEAYQCWDAGWLNDQERIAKAMGAGEKPAEPKKAANGSANPRARVARKQGKKTTATPRRRSTEAHMH